MFKTGDKVAWNLQDGNVMAGTVALVHPNTLEVRRVDGGTCLIFKGYVRLATSDDILNAVRFFNNIGK